MTQVKSSNSNIYLKGFSFPLSVKSSRNRSKVNFSVFKCASSLSCGHHEPDLPSCLVIVCQSCFMRCIVLKSIEKSKVFLPAANEKPSVIETWCCLRPSRSSPEEKASVCRRRATNGERTQSLHPLAAGLPPCAVSLDEILRSSDTSLKYLEEGSWTAAHSHSC